MKKLLLMGLWVLLGVGELVAQDPQFTQYYSAPLYLNPAFTGTTGQHRASVNYRNHWSSLPKAFVTYAFAYDYNLPASNSNVGVIFTRDQAGTASLSSTSVGAIYSYSIPLSDGLRAMPALQVGFVSQSMDFSKLVFGDQLAFGNPNAPTSDPDVRNLDNNNHFDFGSGLIVYDKNFWAGIALHHINQPNQSALGDVSRLPMRLTMHAGYKIPIKQGPMRSGIESSINPSFNYRKQGRFDQLDVGFNYFYRMLMLGLWYRGIPLQQDMPRTINHDALAVSFGLSMNNLNFGYSYDMTVSKLGSASSGGSHEISLVMQLQVAKHPGKVSRKDKYNPCPAFMPKYLWRP
ncbi:MAG: type IX secretion system membrane protein PorP/SprF [Cyclobacteriaceae bacterium]